MKTPCDECLIALGRVYVQPAAAAGPWILAATILGSSMAFIDGTVVNVAVPTLQATFHASVVDVQWVVASYGIFLSSLILAGGALGDLFGRRRMFLIGVGIFAAASTVCGFASSTHELIIARCLQGIGAALLVPGSLALISVVSTNTPAAKRSVRGPASRRSPPPLVRSSADGSSSMPPGAGLSC